MTTDTTAATPVAINKNRFHCHAIPTISQIVPTFSGEFVVDVEVLLSGFISKGVCISIAESLLLWLSLQLLLIRQLLLFEKSLALSDVVMFPGLSRVTEVLEFLLSARD